jgi:misacylated tRNA(Ala) deacylase
MSTNEITVIQNEANKLICEGREVHVEVEELNKLNEARVVTLGNGRSVGKALPDDYTGGIKRVVVIDGVDRNP